MSCSSLRRPSSSLAFLLIVATSLATAQTYKVIGTYQVMGTTVKSVAVDSASRRLLVASERGVTVLNADTGAVTGTVSDLKDAEDLLLVPQADNAAQREPVKAFATNHAGEVVSFSLADLKASPVLKMETPGAVRLCYDRLAETVEAFSTGGWLATIDPATSKVLTSAKTIAASGQVACGMLNRVYIADPSANVVHILNHETNENEGDIPMKSGHGPSGVTLDTKGRRLFVGCDDGSIEIVDTDADFTFSELKGGKGTAHEAFVWLPQGKGQWKAAAFITQSNGTLSAVRMNAFINYTMGGQYTFSPGLGPLTYDAATHHLFIGAQRSGTPVVLVVGY